LAGAVEFAMVICAPIVVVSALLGEVQLLARLLLIAIGVLATVDAAWRVFRGFTGERAAG
jgi:hypothetical protein